jgi:hypothetical protein
MAFIRVSQLWISRTNPNTNINTPKQIKTARNGNGGGLERFSSRHCPADSGHGESKDYEEYASTQHHPILSHVL